MLTLLPYTRCLQYIRAISACGTMNRMFAIAKLSGFDAVLQVVASKHAMSLKLKSSSMVLSCWMWKRNRKCTTAPLILVHCGDTRRTHSEIDDMLKGLPTGPCCLNPWRTRKIRARCVKLRGEFHHLTRDVCGEDNLEVIAKIGRITIHNGRVECLHARGARHNTESSS